MCVFFLLRRSALLISAKAADLIGMTMFLFFLLGKIIGPAALRSQQQDMYFSNLALISADVVSVIFC
jgi:hypothetical protein